MKINYLFSDIIKTAPPTNNSAIGKVSEIHEMSAEDSSEDFNKLITENDIFEMYEVDVPKEPAEEIDAFTARKPFQGGQRQYNQNQFGGSSGARPKQKFKVPSNYKGKCLLCLSSRWEAAVRNFNALLLITSLSSLGINMRTVTFIRWKHLARNVTFALVRPYMI